MRVAQEGNFLSIDHVIRLSCFNVVSKMRLSEVPHCSDDLMYVHCIESRIFDQEF